MQMGVSLMFHLGNRSLWSYLRENQCIAHALSSMSFILHMQRRIILLLWPPFGTINDTAVKPVLDQIQSLQSWVADLWFSLTRYVQHAKPNWHSKLSICAVEWLDKQFTTKLLTSKQLCLGIRLTHFILVGSGQHTYITSINLIRISH